MTGRQVGIVFGLLAVLVGLLVFLNLGGDGDRGSEDALDLAASVPSELSLIRIHAPGGDSVRLERVRGAWSTNGYPADAERVEELVADLSSAPPARVVARSSGSHERMGVTPERARLVELGAADAPDLAFLVGRAGTDGRYVRIPDEDG